MFRIISFTELTSLKSQVPDATESVGSHTLALLLSFGRQ